MSKNLAVVAALVLSASGASAAEPPLRLMMLDADGGAAAIFVTPQGKSLLVDTGWPMTVAANGTNAPPAATITRVLAGMKRLGLTRLDYVLITHYHFDHVGGVHDILARIPVGTIIDHGANRETLPPEQMAGAAPSHPVSLYARYEKALTGVKRRVVKPGDTLAIDALQLTFVTGDGIAIDRPLSGAGKRSARCDTPARSDDTGENGRSLGFVATYGKARILDLGDLTWNEENRLVCPIDKLGPIDVLLVGHHGSESSNNPSLIAATAPRVALVANGARKGGDAAVYRTFEAETSKPAVWYQHFATRSPEANPKPDRIANPVLEVDGAHSLDVAIEKSGAVRVVNTRNGYAESYPPR